MKRLQTALMACLCLTLISLSAQAQTQTPLKRVYDESINPLMQIGQALDKAKKEGKHVVCQVGGNWCPWCLKFADFVSNDSTIANLIDNSFVYIHVNYQPHQKSDAEKTLNAQKMMERLGNPSRFGYPVFVVLNAQGDVIHTQDSSFLEEGKGYNKEKVLRFFKCWTPEAVKL